jgi:hypothetical protein
MFRKRKQICTRLSELIAKFKEKGALGPEKTMAPEKLGLQPRLKEGMQRRLGRTGIFVEVNGKYYLSERQLKEVQERISAGRF